VAVKTLLEPPRDLQSLDALAISPHGVLGDSEFRYPRHPGAFASGRRGNALVTVRVRHLLPVGIDAAGNRCQRCM